MTTKVGNTVLFDNNIKMIVNLIDLKKKKLRK